MKPIVLASSSPRRRELLSQTGLSFIVDTVDTEENNFIGTDPEEMAKSISLAKAIAVAHRHPKSIIIGADTIGVLGRKLLGKPTNAIHAKEMLTLLSDKCHKVITGFSIIDTETGKTTSLAETTLVYFKRLSPAQIKNYIQTGEPLDKAGAYAIQGSGAELVDHIEGDFNNVVGLPVYALLRELLKFGINLPE
jgi:septum formation protein